jgi:hypothetical protein
MGGRDRRFVAFLTLTALFLALLLGGAAAGGRQLLDPVERSVLVASSDTVDLTSVLARNRPELRARAGADARSVAIGMVLLAVVTALGASGAASTGLGSPRAGRPERRGRDGARCSRAPPLPV